MNRITIVLIAVTAISFAGCKNNSGNNNSANTTAAANANAQATVSPETTDSIRHAQLNKLNIANENDPACGMPLLRGFDDTATYKGKLIGFCSKDCRDSFMRKPEAFAIKYKK